MRGPRQEITLEDKLKAMQEVQRIHALAKTWRSVMPNQKRPNFEAAADAVMRRAMNAQVVGRELPLEIQDGRMMHEHEPRTARILERTLRNGIIHPDVLHSFQSGRTKRGRVKFRSQRLPHDPNLPRVNLYVQHSDADLHYPSHFEPNKGFMPKTHVHPSHIQLEQAAEGDTVSTARDVNRPQAGPVHV